MIRIDICTSVAAFRPELDEGWRQEVAWLLHDLADRLMDGEMLPASLRDHNGNRVGKVERMPEEKLSTPPREKGPV